MRFVGIDGPFDSFASVGFQRNQQSIDPPQLQG